MIRWLINKSLQFRYLVVFITVIILFAGINHIRNVPMDVFPEFAPPMIEIQTEGPGMSATEVENLVTVQIEEALNNVPGLETIRSKSVQGLSSVRLWFERGSDPILIRQLTRERLETVTPNLLPPADAPIILPPFSSTSRVLKIGLSSDVYSLEDLSMIAYWKIVVQLKQVPGVADVYIWGERWKMLTAEADPALMKYNNVSLDEVMESVSEAMDFGLLQYTPGAKSHSNGFIDTPNNRLYLMNDISSSMDPDKFAGIPIGGKKKLDGTPLLLGDVANTTWAHQPLIGDAVIDGEEGLLLVVSKMPWGNTLEVTKGVEKALEEMKPGLSNIKIDTTIFRPATYIDMSINNLMKSLVIGSILVFLAILFFLYEWRIALISTLIIPISLISTLFVLSTYGATINIMVLTGMIVAIGVVVDDAIVDVENVIRRSRQMRNDNKKSLKEVIRDASLEIRGVVIYSSLIEIAVLLPVFFFGGLSGAFFNPLATVYVLAALVSPFIAMTVTPALIYILLSNFSIKEKESPILPWLRLKYGNILSVLIKLKGKFHISILGFSILIILTVVPFLGRELLPSFKENDFLMHWLLEPGVSREEVVRTSKDVGNELLEIPGVRNFGMHTGRAVGADEIVGMYFAENWVSIDPNVDYDETLSAIEETVYGYPGLIRDVQTYLKERIREVLSGSGHALVLRIYGPDLKGLREVAENVRQKVSEDVEGLSELYTSLQTDVPQIQIEVDLNKAQIYGIKPGDVRRTVSVLINGVEVSDRHDSDKVYEIMMWSSPEIRNSPGDLEKLLIDVPSGGYVELGKIADINIVPTPNVIQRENNSRYIDVEADISDRDITAVANNIEDLLQEMKLPLGYHVELIGESKEIKDSQQNILIASIVAVIIVFFLLYATFNSWRLAIITFITIPTGLTGGVFAVYLFDGGILSLGSLVGFLTVLGVATRNGIMLISHYQNLEYKEGQSFGPELIIRGAGERITPILMTTFTTGLALVPIMIAGKVAGHEIEYPMAIVIIGGLITSTLLNIFIVPALYYWFGKKKNDAK
jgi:CzcA family heavy metal efflux pump